MSFRMEQKGAPLSGIKELTSDPGFNTLVIRFGAAQALHRPDTKFDSRSA